MKDSSTILLYIKVKWSSRKMSDSYSLNFLYRPEGKCKILNSGFSPGSLILSISKDALEGISDSHLNKQLLE